MKDRSLSPKDSTVLRAVEHHHFATRGGFCLFDVNALTVVRSNALDKTLLDLACLGIERSRLIESAEGIPGATRVEERVEFLVENRFLLDAEDEPTLAKLRPPTGYSTFMINVAQRCNLTCPYCYVNKGLFDYEKKPIPRMKTKTADEMVDRIYQLFPGLETYGYHFYGGEPLLNFDAIRRMVQAAEAKATASGTHADFHITTNGTLLTSVIADFMDEHRFTVYFSIDGNQETHDQLRQYTDGRGSYQDVERNLAYLKTKHGVHLIGSSVIRKGFSLEGAIGLLEGHGVQQCKAERVRLRDGDVLSLEGQEHDTYLKDIEGLVDHYIEYLSSGRKPMDFRLSSKILQLLTKTRRDFFCPAGERMFGISANGEIYPCALHVGRPQSKLGDVLVGIDTEKQTVFRAKFSPANQVECRTCWTRHLCGGGCSAMVDRFGHENCLSLRAESEAGIAIFQHFVENDPIQVLGLVSPKVVKWVNGELNDASELTPTEAAASRVASECV